MSDYTDHEFRLTLRSLHPGVKPEEIAEEVSFIVREAIGLPGALEHIGFTDVQYPADGPNRLHVHVGEGVPPVTDTRSTDGEALAARLANGVMQMTEEAIQRLGGCPPEARHHVEMLLRTGLLSGLASAASILIFRAADPGVTPQTLAVAVDRVAAVAGYKAAKILL